VPWKSDRWLLGALVVGLLLRLGPILYWIKKPCVRDECTYQDLARAIADGQGMVGSYGWLWAPGYPMLMALHGKVTGYPGAVEATQVAVSFVSTILLYVLTRDQAGICAARIAAWLFAVNPTHVFYAASLWSECIYTGLLLGGLLALGWARGGDHGRGWLPGVLIGGCVLFRGVATYMLPIFVVALLWGRWRTRAAWLGAAACVVAAILVVSPYSVYATRKFGGLVVSDRTMGQMMWLGNNDFAPMTFDWGNGTLSDRDYDEVKSRGRPHCGFEDEPVRQDDCERDAGFSWIRAHPQEFLARVPLRVSQMVTPHSLLTRHLRWGKWKGIPPGVREGLIHGIVASSFLVLVGGTLGIAARGRGWFAATSAAIVGYHVAAIAVLAGLSRYRVPLEPLWMVFAAQLLAEPGATFAALRAHPWRGALAGGAVGALVVLMLRYLPAGYPDWETW
jgi:hypothetical protein